jgi:hypothetical protein
MTRTFGDALNCALEVAVGFLQGEDQVDVRPVWKQLLQRVQLRQILPLQLAELALVCRRVDGCGGGMVAVGLLARARAARTMATSATAS